MLKKSPRETNRKTLGSSSLSCNSKKKERKHMNEKATTKHGKSLRRQIVERVVGSVGEKQPRQASKNG